jgi:hypothetical protein
MLFIDVLKEKYNLDKDGKLINNQNKIKNSKDFEKNIKKSGLFTGTKSSISYQKNLLDHQSKHSLGLNKSKNIIYLNDNALKLLENISENEQQSSVVYRRNVINTKGAKKSAVPHSVMAKIVSKLTPNKPRDGRIPGMLNTKWGQEILYKKLKIIPRLFQNQ